VTKKRGSVSRKSKRVGGKRKKMYRWEPLTTAEDKKRNIDRKTRADWKNRKAIPVRARGEPSRDRLPI